MSALAGGVEPANGSSPAPSRRTIPPCGSCRPVRSGASTACPSGKSGYGAARSSEALTASAPVCGARGVAPIPGWRRVIAASDSVTAGSCPGALGSLPPSIAGAGDRSARRWSRTASRRAVRATSAVPAERVDELVERRVDGRESRIHRAERALQRGYRVAELGNRHEQRRQVESGQAELRGGAELGPELSA